ncbi:MAG: hybrid sensor histidine kinase/response regulator [Caldilinea sp.]|nr:hybrid sensor histidine kinase/response regulator [Caldilinea sp.]MDW8440904.1 hybrid sensor histidine kinase/response regulator [Caldilineaceae bacterium]
MEDDADLNVALTEMLQFYGYQVTGVYNGREALDMLHRFVPDVIICDIAMPVMDGYTFLQRLRNDPELRLLPVIFLTAYGAAENRRRAKAIGVEDYLTKPVDPKDLVASIENALQRRQLIEAEIERNMEQLRSQIVGLLQHEFRNPLTFILGYAELLAASDDSIAAEELRMVAQAILEGGRRLQHLIENFLLMAELQSLSGAPQHVEPIDPYTLWNDVFREFADCSQLKLPEAESNPQEIDAIINGDVRLLSEALRRLHEYAQRVCKSGSDGSGTVESGVTYNAPYIGFYFRCNHAEMLTPPLHEDAEAIKQAWINEIDTDLSLTIARSVARLHGGRLTVDHGAEKTLTLTLWLPVGEREGTEGNGALSG